MGTERKISSVQLALLLFLCSLSAGLTVPYPIASAVAIPLGAVLLWVLLIPVCFLERYGGLFGACHKVGKTFECAVSILLFLYSAFMASRVLGNVGFFMTSSVYPNAHGGIFLLATLVVCAYAACLGIEPLGRMGLWVTIYAIGTLILLLLGLSREIHLSNWLHSFLETWKTSGSLSVQVAFSGSDAILFAILFSRVHRGNPFKTTGGWLILSSAALSGTVLLTNASLGAYAESRLFPLHAAASAARFSAQGRMDLLFLFLYMFCAFIRGALWIYGGCVCLRRIIPRVRLGYRTLITAGVTLLFAFLPILYRSVSFWNFWAVLLIAVLPLLLLLLPGTRTRKGNCS